MGPSECREVPEEAAETLPEAPGESRVPRSVYCDCPRTHEAFPRVRGLTQRPWAAQTELRFFHDLSYDSLLSGHQVVDSSELR